MATGCMDYATAQDATSMMESAAPIYLKEALEKGYEIDPEIRARFESYLPGGLRYTGYWRTGEDGELIPEPRDVVAQRTIERKARVAAYEAEQKLLNQKEKEEAKLVKSDKNAVQSEVLAKQQDVKNAAKGVHKVSGKAGTVQKTVPPKPEIHSSSLANAQQEAILNLRDDKNKYFRDIIADQIAQNHEVAMKSGGMAQATQQELPDHIKNNPHIIKQIADRLLRQHASDRYQKIVTLILKGGKIAFYDPKVDMMLFIDKENQERSKLCVPTLEMKEKLKSQGKVAGDVSSGGKGSNDEAKTASDKASSHSFEKNKMGGNDSNKNQNDAIKGLSEEDFRKAALHAFDKHMLASNMTKDGRDNSKGRGVHPDWLGAKMRTIDALQKEISRIANSPTDVAVLGNGQVVMLYDKELDSVVFINKVHPDKSTFFQPSSELKKNGKPVLDKNNKPIILNGRLYFEWKKSNMDPDVVLKLLD